MTKERIESTAFFFFRFSWRFKRWFQFVTAHKTISHTVYFHGLQARVRPPRRFRTMDDRAEPIGFRIIVLCVADTSRPTRRWCIIYIFFLFFSFLLFFYDLRLTRVNDANSRKKARATVFSISPPPPSAHHPPRSEHSLYRCRHRRARARTRTGCPIRIYPLRPNRG